jgi:hypothetical protein
LVPPPRFDRIPAPPYQAGELTRLLSSFAVQKELKLTEDQIVELRKQLDQARNELSAFHKGVNELPRDLTPTERQDKQRELQAPAIAIERKMVAQSLTAEQRERFRQIVVQSDGPIAFGRDEVLAALKLTPEQVDKIARIVLNYQNAVSQSGRPVGGGQVLSPDKQQAAQPGAGGRIFVLDPTKVRELARQAVEKAVAVLTDEQKAKWKELIGEPMVEK